VGGAVNNRCDPRRHWPRDRGQALVLIALSLVVLLGFLGLATDVGYLRYMKRRLQAAADAGAIAGASEKKNGGNYLTAARNDASLNRFTNGTNGVTVTVNNPPASGPNSGNFDYVEVTVSQNQPTFFAKIFGINSVPLGARAVAGPLNQTPGCIYVLDPSKSGALTLNGAMNLSPQCAVIVDSDSPSGITVNTGGCPPPVLTAGNIGVVGNYLSNWGSACFSTTPVIGIAAVPDPLASWNPPSVPNRCDRSGVTHISSGTPTFSPNPVDGMFVFCGPVNITGGSVTFNPGIYIINSFATGLNINGTTTVQGSGVTFWVHRANATPFNINGSANVTLSAPTSGPFANILFYQDRGIISGSYVNGSSNASFTGILYFPSAGQGQSFPGLNFNGQSGSRGCLTIIADTLWSNGVSDLNNSCFPTTGGSQKGPITLAE
jgi:Flp pilus assembly protein TadG